MTGEELPKGWVAAAFGELVWNRDNEREPVNAKEREGRKGNVPYYGAAGQVGWIDKAVFDEDLLLVGEDGVQFFDPFKPKTYLVSGPAWVNNHAHVLTALDGGPSLRYLKHYLDQFNYLGYANGTTRLKLTRSAMDRIPVPLPPLAEQGHIVAEVERRLSHVDAAERSLTSAARRLGAARVSILRAGVAGHLTPGVQLSRSMVEECTEAGVVHAPSSAGSGWVDVSLDAIATVGSGSTPKRGEARYWENGSIAWVTSGQVVGGKVSSPAELITPVALAETSVKVWPAGTLLVAMYGEGRTRGHCAELLIDATCNQACAAIALKPPFQRAKDYVRLVLQSRYEENRVLGSGGVQENLNLGLVKAITVTLPPFDTQAVIIAEVERRLSLVQAADDAVQAQLRRCAALRRSILAAAFRGELVPQDPDDEPAETLLQRIRDQRAGAARSKTVKKASKGAGRKPRVKKEAVA